MKSEASNLEAVAKTLVSIWLLQKRRANFKQGPTETAHSGARVGPGIRGGRNGREGAGRWSPQLLPVWSERERR